MLFDYQKKAVEFIRRNKKAYLAMDMGTGKTLTALVAANELGKRHILVIAEKNEIENSQNFRKEVINHLPALRYISLRVNDLDFAKSSPRAVCVVNPEALIKHCITDIKNLFDFVIVDEATLAKTTTSKRSQQVRKICKAMPYVVLLSGTPVMNGAAELFHPLLLIDHSLAGDGSAKSRMRYEKIFAGGHYRKIRNSGNWFKDYAWWAKGANNIRELRYLAEDKFFFLRKEETGIFQKKDRGIVEVPMTLSWLAEYKNAWNEYLKKAEKRNVNLDNVRELQRLIENGQIYQVNSRWKAKRVAQEIASGMYGNQRIVVFGMFRETDKILQQEFKKLGISFRTFEEINEWKKGEERVLVGRIKAHGKGGNVPEASVVLFVDMDFVPANNIQAENRIDRPEQKNSMTIRYYLTANEEVDTRIRKINQDKMHKIEQFTTPLTTEELAEMPARVSGVLKKYELS